MAAQPPPAFLTTADGNIITGKGPGASFAYAYRLLEEFKGASVVEELKKGMMYEF